MNKKGIGFPTFFVVAVLITLPFVLLAVSKQLNASGRPIGAQQANIFKADLKRDLILNELDKNAGIAFAQTLVNLAKNGGFSDDVKFIEGCVALNSKNNPENIIFPDLSKFLNQEFSQHLYALKIGSANVISTEPYELYIEGSIIRGIPLRTSYYSLGNQLTKQLWTGFSFKPSFTIIQKNELNLYPQILKRLKLIYNQCKLSQDLKRCSDGRLINDAVIESSSQVSKFDSDILLYKFSFIDFDRPVCYALNFPSLENRGIKI